MIVKVTRKKGNNYIRWIFVTKWLNAQSYAPITITFVIPFVNSKYRRINYSDHRICKQLYHMFWSRPEHFENVSNNIILKLVSKDILKVLYFWNNINVLWSILHINKLHLFEITGSSIISWNKSFVTSCCLFVTRFRLR